MERAAALWLAVLWAVVVWAVVTDDRSARWSHRQLVKALKREG